MKILRITSEGYDTGGVENGIVLVQPLLEARGYDVRTLASASRPDLPHFNTYAYKPLAPYEKLLYTFNPYSYRALKKALRDFEPDVVHVHTIGEASASIFMPLRNYPTILTVHGPEVYSKSLLLWCFPSSAFKTGTRARSDLTVSGWLRFIYHRLLLDPLFAIGMRHVDKVVTLSHYMHDLVQKEGVENEYVPNGTALMPYTPITNNRTLLYVGRLEKLKGVQHLLNALPKILARFADTHLAIAGDGGARDELEAQARALGLNAHVTFLGHIGRTELEARYRESTIVMMPSVYPEAFGKVGIEAMSVGRPVIASDVGGVSDWLVSGKTGFAVPPGNSEKIADAVTRLFADPQLLASMSKAARKKSEEFSIESHVEKMDALYRKVAAKKSPRA